jgi:hypothetical protein
MTKQEKQELKYEKKIKRITKLNKVLEEAKHKRYIPRWLDNVITIAVIGLLYYVSYYWLRRSLYDMGNIIGWFKTVGAILISFILTVGLMLNNTGKGEK